MQRCFRLLAVVLLACLVACGAAQAVQCPQGCASDFEAAVGRDGLTYINTCVAKCQGVEVLRSQKVVKAAGQRPVTEADMRAHAAENLKFIDFARVRRIRPTLRGSATDSSSVSGPSLQGIPVNRVIMYDVPRGAIYASAAPASLPSDTAAVSIAAVDGQPGELYAPQEPAAPQPGSGTAQPESEPEILNPELILDVVVPEPSPAPTAASSDDVVDVPELQPTVGMDLGSSSSSSTEQQQGRKLRMVMQPDGRKDITTAPSGLPLAAVGQLLGHGQEWHCSASLIGERTILTAAHCVLDRSSGAFARGLYFVPGRYRDASGVIHAPYGAYDVAEVYIMSQFVNGQPQDMWKYDMAVLKLQENVQVGKVAGYLGLEIPAVKQQQQQQAATEVPLGASSVMLPTSAAAEPPSADSKAAARKQRNNKNNNKGGRKAQPGMRTPPEASTLPAAEPSNPAAETWTGSLTTAGYPSDRPEGTLVSADCQAEQRLSDAVGATIKLVCSTHLGQSGSPVVSQQRQVRGVISFEILGADGYNGASAITHYMYKNLIQPNLE